MKKKLPEILYAKLIEDMCEEANINVNIYCEETEDFSDKIGVHQSRRQAPICFT